METEKLYYQDPYLTAFTATVLTCEPAKTGFAGDSGPHRLLPGGRRPAGGPRHPGRRCRHRCPRKGRRDFPHLRRALWKPVPPWTGAIDWPRRFDHMQQHSGEHILSGLLCSLLRLRQRGLPPGGGHRHHRLQPGADLGAGAGGGAPGQRDHLGGHPGGDHLPLPRGAGAARTTAAKRSSQARCGSSPSPGRTAAPAAAPTSAGPGR